MSKVQFNMMGVINITPNSFSDGGKNYTPKDILNNCLNMTARGVECFDFGAESTAPFNHSISESEELSRFEDNLFPVLEDVLSLGKTISIDTYRPSTFLAVARRVLEIDSKTKLIWNDVSGKVDQDLLKTLKKVPGCTYVLSHNLAPTRMLTGEHIKHIRPQLDLESYFKTRLDKLSFHKNILLDPCFGFSKSFEQNWELIRSLPELTQKFQQGWLLGISKKSFLKKRCQDLGDTEPIYLEFLHLGILLNWQEQLASRAYYLRVHDVAMGQFLTFGQQNLT